MGNLAIKKGWPAMMQEIWRNKEKYESYFLLGDWYVSGDSALWIKMDIFGLKVESMMSL